MGPDFRDLVRKSRKQAEQYHILYITHLQDFDTMKVVFKKYLSFLYVTIRYHLFLEHYQTMVWQRP